MFTARKLVFSKTPTKLRHVITLLALDKSHIFDDNGPTDRGVRDTRLISDILQ